MRKLGWLAVTIVVVACGQSPVSESEDTDGESSSTTVAASTSGTASSTGGATSSSSSGASQSGSTGGESSTSGAESSTSGDPEPTDCDRLAVFEADLQAAANDEQRWTLTDAFFAETIWGEHGLPIRCEGAVAFVMTDASDAAVSVAGDFNGWDPEATPLEHVVVGFPVRTALVELEEPMPGSLYKFVRDGVDYVADPRARRFGWDEFGEFSLTDPREGQSHLERWPGFEQGVGDLQPRNVVVYVPADAMTRPAPGAGLPVLYMHDGQNLWGPEAFLGGWQVDLTMDAAIEAGEVAPMFIVAIDNTDARMDEYSHVPETLGGRQVGGRGDEYADFVVGGVKPFIDARYPTASGPQTTGVMGSSMGGLISLYIGHRHRDVFGFAASMSGTLGWGRFGGGDEGMADLYAADPPTGLVIYLDSGGDGPCPNGGSDNYCETLDMQATLQGLGWQDEIDLFHRWATDAPHNEPAWAARFGPAIRDWFPGAP